MKFMQTLVRQDECLRRQVKFIICENPVQIARIQIQYKSGDYFVCCGQVENLIPDVA